MGLPELSVVLPCSLYFLSGTQQYKLNYSPEVVIILALSNLNFVCPNYLFHFYVFLNFIVVFSSST